MTQDTELIAALARIKDLEAALKQNDQALLAYYRLPPVSTNLFGLLLSMATVTPEMIQQRLEIATESKVAMHRLRRQLEPFGIIVQSKRNVGYWLDDETKKRVQETINPTPATLQVTEDA
jgi:hypothetical protein